MSGSLCVTEDNLGIPEELSKFGQVNQVNEISDVICPSGASGRSGTSMGDGGYVGVEELIAGDTGSTVYVGGYNRKYLFHVYISLES